MKARPGPKIMVCGSIGYGGGAKIRDLYSFLRRKGFSTLDHITDSRMNYSGVRDFRRKKALSHRIVEYDLRQLEKSDIVVVISNGPSYGTGVEMYVAKNSGKTVVLLAPQDVPTPWPVNFADYVVVSIGQLSALLGRLYGGTPRP